MNEFYNILLEPEVSDTITILKFPRDCTRGSLQSAFFQAEVSVCYLTPRDSGRYRRVEVIT